MEASNTSKRQKGRSPRYPGIPLDQAVERARALFEKEGQYPTNVQTVMSHWNYAPRSGGGAVAIAALKAFGLIADEGSGDTRKVTITHDAQEILISDDRTAVDALVKKAALLPPAHKDLWDRYGPSLPSDASLTLYLTRERGFTQDGAKWFIQVYKRTIAFAKLTERDATVSPPSQNPPAESDDSEIMAPTTIEAPPATATATAPTPGIKATPRTVQVPYSPSGWALLQAPFPMTENEWDAMLAVLEAMKPGLVTPE